MVPLAQRLEGDLLTKGGRKRGEGYYLHYDDKDVVERNRFTILSSIYTSLLYWTY